MRDKAMLIETTLSMFATGPEKMVCRVPAHLLEKPLAAIGH